MKITCSTVKAILYPMWVEKRQIPFLLCSHISYCRGISQEPPGLGWMQWDKSNVHTDNVTKDKGWWSSSLQWLVGKDILTNWTIFG